MKRVACYVRVSTQEQKAHGLSVDNQITALEQFCKDNGYICAGVYNDAGISAHASYRKRPALLQMIDDCQNNKIDLIIMTKLDRFFRSVKDYYEVMAQIGEIPWRAIWEDYETETSAGMFKVNIMLSIAQAEAERTAERINNTFEYKRAKGEYLGTPPFGYIRKDGHLYKDEETKEIVEKAFDTFLKTHSTTAVIKMMYKEGYNCSRHRVQRLIYGSAYAGDANGSKCEPYITQEQYNLIQELKLRHLRTPKYFDKVYLFNTICRCGICGAPMRSLGSKQGNTFYYQYGCTGTDGKIKHDKGIYISEKKIERYLLTNIEKEIKAYNMRLDVKEKNDIYDINIAKKKKLEEKLDRIGIRFEEGDITQEEYKNKRKAIQSEIASLVIEKQHSKIVIPDNFQAMYDSLDKAHRHQFWFSIVKSIIINENRSIEIVFL